MGASGIARFSALSADCGTRSVRQVGNHVDALNVRGLHDRPTLTTGTFPRVTLMGACGVAQIIRRPPAIGAGATLHRTMRAT